MMHGPIFLVAIEMLHFCHTFELAKPKPIWLIGGIYMAMKYTFTCCMHRNVYFLWKTKKIYKNVDYKKILYLNSNLVNNRTQGTM